MNQEVSGQMRRLGIREEDIREKFVRSSAPGGQNVNKVSTAVYLRHEPTGIEVKCSLERSQSQNRLAARRILVDKVRRLFEGRRLAEQAAREKARRRNRPRSAAAKNRMLESKKRRAQKKGLRRRVGYDE